MRFYKVPIFFKGEQMLDKTEKEKVVIPGVDFGINVQCKCGEQEFVKSGNFTINLVGVIQFFCRKCGSKIATGGLL